MLCASAALMRFFVVLFAGVLGGVTEFPPPPIQTEIRCSLTSLCIKINAKSWYIRRAFYLSFRGWCGESPEIMNLYHIRESLYAVESLYALGVPTADIRF